jgi:hypothetical protein
MDSRLVFLFYLSAFSWVVALVMAGRILVSRFSRQESLRMAEGVH